MTQVCEQYGLKPGDAFDVKNVFDFELAADGNRVGNPTSTMSPKR